MSVSPVAPGWDVELVARTRAGEAEAREELARECRRSAYLLAFHLTGNRDEALDVAQEAMLKFFVHLDRIEADRPVRPWLFSIVRNQARDLWRRKKVRRADSLEARGRDLSLEIVDPGANTSEMAERNDLKRRIWRALSQLSQEQREIVVLRDFHDLSYAEISETLEIPSGTVMSRLHYGRKKLRKLLSNGEGRKR